MIEATAVAMRKDDAPAYLDRAQIEALGAIEGRAIAYERPRVLAWSAVIDGLVVLKTERPPTFVRPPRPWQNRQD